MAAVVVTVVDVVVVVVVAGLAGSFAGSLAAAGAAGLAGSVWANADRVKAHTIADAIQLTREFLMVLTFPKKLVLIIISYNEAQTRS